MAWNKTCCDYTEERIQRGSLYPAQFECPLERGEDEKDGEKAHEDKERIEKSEKSLYEVQRLYVHLIFQ